MRFAFLFFSLAALPLCAQSDVALNSFLREHYKLTTDEAKEYNVQYADARVDLNGDGKAETLVYMTTPGRFCGSGGCSLLVLKSAGATFQILGKLTIVQTPVRVLNTSHNGWRDLAVTVRGGGIPSYEAELRFNGKQYPSNPSVPPAIPLKTKQPGRTLIGDDAFKNAKPLR